MANNLQSLELWTTDKNVLHTKCPNCNKVLEASGIKARGGMKVFVTCRNRNKGYVLKVAITDAYDN